MTGISALPAVFGRSPSTPRACLTHSWRVRVGQWAASGMRGTIWPTITVPFVRTSCSARAWNGGGMSTLGTLSWQRRGASTAFGAGFNANMRSKRPRRSRRDNEPTHSPHFTLSGFHSFECDSTQIQTVRLPPKCDSHVRQTPHLTWPTVDSSTSDPSEVAPRRRRQGGVLLLL